MVMQKLMKSTWHPRFHDMDIQFAFKLESATNTDTTIVPAVMHDEGLGAASAFKANPQNASFAEVNMPNCFPESRLDKIMCTVEFFLTKIALETDKLHKVPVAFMPITMAFEDDVTAKDEITGSTIGTILEMQQESTDRQCFPLWNGSDMTQYMSAGSPNVLDAAVPGLTASQAIEAVTFDPQTFYDNLQYYSTSEKMRKVQRGLNWRYLSRNNPSFKTNITLSSKNKFLNPYSFFGILLHVPKVDSVEQYYVAADTTIDSAHVGCRIITRYNEWNENFNMER